MVRLSGSVPFELEEFEWLWVGHVVPISSGLTFDTHTSTPTHTQFSSLPRVACLPCTFEIPGVGSFSHLEMALQY